MTTNHLGDSEPPPDGLHQSVYTPAQPPAIQPQSCTILNN